MNEKTKLITNFIDMIRQEGVIITVKRAIQWGFHLAGIQILKIVKTSQYLINHIRIRRIPYEAKVFPFVDQVNIVSLGDVTPRMKWLNKFLTYEYSKIHKHFNKQVKRYFHQPIGVKGFEITYKGIRYQRQDHPNLIEKEKTVFELISGCNINSVLDLGCADSYYSVLFERRGYKVTAVEGTDYHFENAYIVKSCLDAKFRLIHADIENDKLWAYLSGDSFDITLLLDLIEHCENPSKLLRRIRKISKYIIIVVPDEGKFQKRLLRSTDIDHIYQFDLTGLKNILNLSGFKIREVRKKVGKLFVLAA